MANLGAVRIGEAITVPAQTYASNGAPVDADSLPTYRIYEENTDTPLVTGSFAKLDDPNTVGFYAVRVTVAAASGFDVDKTYVVKKSALVGGVSVEAVDTFRTLAAAGTGVSDPGDLTTLDGVSAGELTANQIAGIVSQIDLDIHNLLRGGKLSALKYTEVGGVGSGLGRSADRAVNLRALLDARRYYAELLESRAAWETSQYEDPDVTD